MSLLGLEFGVPAIATLVQAAVNEALGAITCTISRC